MTDGLYRQALISLGVVRPVRARHKVFATDHVGRRSAAADIFYGEGIRVAQVVVANPYADPAVKTILQRWIARAEAA